LILGSERKQIEELAAQWVLRADRGLSADESAALAAWLDASVANRLAYLRLKSGWQRTERLAALQGSEDFADKSETHVRWRAMALAAAVLVLLGIAAGAFLHFHAAAPAVYTTQLGERPVLRLSDGTRIQLNTDTQVQTDVTRVARTVTLERGEAFFEVVHDDKRPFVVIAGNRRITDLGTKFSVRRDGDNVRVIVTEGQVRVDILNAPAPSAPVFANEGNIVVAKADETLVVPKSLKDMAGDLSWRNGMLVFDQETLSSVAEQFNRYNRRRIVVQGRARDIRIGGSFRADNIDSFALLIRGSLGLKVTQEDDQIIISE
jgi:transmembrane sensor